MENLEDNIAVARLNRDLRAAAETMSTQEARYLVDAYYAIQKMRIAQGNRVFAMSEEPHGVIKWLGDQSEILEGQIKAALDRYSMAHPVGKWMRGVVGIGPVIAAGLLAHIDITKAPTVGHIWRFAGLDPTMKWEKGQKRPFNAALKVLCWKLGESFKKTSGHDEGYYGKLYRERKEKEVARNQSGEHKEESERCLKSRKMDKSSPMYKAYAEGRLPDGRIDLRATRWAVKLFLSDLHRIWYRLEFGKEPPKPYPIAILGHAHERIAPNV